MIRRASGFTLQQLLLVIVLVALLLGLTMSVVHGPLARRLQQTRVEHLTFSPDGRTLAAGSWNCTLRLWDLSAEKTRDTYKFLYSFRSIAFTPDGKTLVLGSWDGTVKLWDVEGGRERAVIKGHLAPPIRREDGSLYVPWRGVEALAFDPNGKIMATGSGDGRAKLWDLSSGEELIVLKGHADSVDALSFSHDGEILATASSDKTVRLWVVKSGNELEALTGHTEALVSLSFLPSDESLAAIDWNGGLGVWKLGGEDRATASRMDQTPISRPEAFSPDGTLLAGSAGDGRILIWDLISQRTVQSLSGPADDVCSLAFSPDCKTLACGYDLGTVRLWDVASGKQRAILIGEDQQVPWILFAVAFLVWVVAWIKVRPKRVRFGSPEDTGSMLPGNVNTGR